MKIDKDTLNSNIVYCIDEYVRLIEHREILKQKWFHGYTIEGLAKEHNLSSTQIKKILYETGDEILIRASKMSTKSH